MTDSETDCSFGRSHLVSNRPGASVSSPTAGEISPSYVQAGRAVIRTRLAQAGSTARIAAQ